MALAMCKAGFHGSWQEEVLVRDVTSGERLCFALKSDFSREVFGRQEVFLGSAGLQSFCLCCMALVACPCWVRASFCQRWHFCKQVYYSASLRKSGMV